MHKTMFLQLCNVIQATKNGGKVPHMMSSKLSMSTAAAVGDISTAKQELEKCYKRIADLETRIHDLTLQNSIVSWECEVNYTSLTLIIIYILPTRTCRYPPVK